jgi:hypothetical protein
MVCAYYALHSLLVMNERGNTSKPFVLEKNWNFGISTGYPHFDARKYLILLGI